MTEAVFDYRYIAARIRRVAPPVACLFCQDAGWVRPPYNPFYPPSSVWEVCHRCCNPEHQPCP